MALALATISGRFLLPDGVTPRNLHVLVRAETEYSTVKSEAEAAVLSGVYEASTDASGNLTIELPLPGDIQPAGFRWRATFTPFTPEDGPGPESVTFVLSETTTWDKLVSVSNVTITETMLAQFQALRDETVTARDQAVAVGNTNDTIIAGRLGDAASATRAAADRLYATAVSAKAHGAVGDGVANDTAALQAALNAAAGGTLLIPRGTYKVNAALNVPSETNVVGPGATLDFRTLPVGTALNQRFGLRAVGTLAAGSAISTAIPQWSRTVAGIGSTSSIAAGDLVLISNDERPVPGLNRADRDKGELNLVQSVDSATQVTLRTGALFTYGTTALTVAKVTPVSNVTISGLRLLMGGVGSAHTGIGFQYARNVTVEGVTVVGGEDNGVTLRSVYNGTVRDCRLEDSTSSTTLGNTGYGVAVVEGSRFVRVAGNHFENCRHSVAGGGFWPAVFVDVEANTSQRSSGGAAYDCHESTFYWNFRGNRSTAGVGAFIIRGQYITLDDNEVYDCTSSAVQVVAYDGVTEQRGIKIRGTTIRRSNAGIVVDGMANGTSLVDHVKVDVEVSGSDISDLTGANGISLLLRHFRNAVVKDNVIRGAQAASIDLRGLSTAQASNLQVSDNVAQDGAAAGYRIERVNDVHGNVGQAINSNSEGMTLTNCNRVGISGFHSRTSRLAGVQVDTCTVVSLADSVITDANLSASDGVRILASTTVKVNGCVLQATRQAINATTSNYLLLAANDVHLSGSATKILLDASAVNVVNANNL